MVDDVPMSPTLLASVARLGTVPVAVGSSASASGSVNAVVIGNTNEPPPVYGVVGGIVGNQIEAQWSDYARTSPTSTSADASTTIASIPPTFASAATTATPAYIVEDQPSEVPPAAVVVDDESARSQVEDVPMPFVQARISLGSTSASVSAATTPITANADVVVLGEAPPAIANGDGESVCNMVGDVPMSPVDATFTLTAPTATSANTVDVKPGEGPVICDELARTRCFLATY